MQAIADVQCVSAAEAHESICNHSGSCEDKLVCVQDKQRQACDCKAMYEPVAAYADMHVRHLEVVQIAWHIIEWAISCLCNVKDIVSPESSARPHFVRKHDKTTLHKFTWSVHTQQKLMAKLQSKS